jgi:Tripartite tricarboxylate transporter TctB family
MDASERRAETALALIAIALSALFLFEGAKLKPGVFEPIGPGAVPMGVAVITIVLSLLVLRARWRAAPAQRSPDADAAGMTPPERWMLMLGVAVLTLVYAALLHAGAVRYGTATVVYLLATFLLLSDRVRDDLPWAIGLALAFGLGLDYVFRHLLVADLP